MSSTLSIRGSQPVSDSLDNYHNIEDKIKSLILDEEKLLLLYVNKCHNVENYWFDFKIEHDYLDDHTNKAIRQIFEKRYHLEYYYDLVDDDSDEDIIIDPYDPIHYIDGCINNNISDNSPHKDFYDEQNKYQEKCLEISLRQLRQLESQSDDTNHCNISHLKSDDNDVTYETPNGSSAIFDCLDGESDRCKAIEVDRINKKEYLGKCFKALIVKYRYTKLSQEEISYLMDNAKSRWEYDSNLNARNPKYFPEVSDIWKKFNTHQLPKCISFQGHSQSQCYGGQTQGFKSNDVMKDSFVITKLGRIQNQEIMKHEGCKAIIKYGVKCKQYISKKSKEGYCRWHLKLEKKSDILPLEGLTYKELKIELTDDIVEEKCELICRNMFDELYGWIGLCSSGLFGTTYLDTETKLYCMSTIISVRSDKANQWKRRAIYSKLEKCVKRCNIKISTNSIRLDIYNVKSITDTYYKMIKRKNISTVGSIQSITKN